MLNLQSATFRTLARLPHDPTRTITIRRRFMSDLARRFRALKGDIRKSIVELDGFGLRVNAPAVTARQFSFTSSDEKIASFMEWLQEAQRDRILEVRGGTPMQRAGRQAWSNKYILSSYQRGIAHAGENIRRQGGRVSQRWIDAGFNRFVHADRVGLAFTRAFSELKGITEAMDQQISRVLAEGIAEGRGPRYIAGRINDRVDKIGLTRARALAQTETIRAHAEASLNTYEEAGVEGVNAQAEFATARDAAVCPECAALEGTVRSIKDARGIIPVHTNCRCAWLPVIDNPERIKLE